jgi:ribosomal-protein-alanine N-acetyltransferase
MDRKIILLTPRLFLSPFTPADKDAVFEYASNPKVAATVTWHAHETTADSLAFIEFISSKINLDSERPFVAWAIRDPLQQNSAIGSMSFSQFSSIAGQIDYALAETYWGRGIMTEAATAVRDFSFQTYPKLVRLQATCLVENTGSRKVMEKIGMRFEGIARAGMFVKGTPVDVATYALLREDLGD